MKIVNFTTSRVISERMLKMKGDFDYWEVIRKVFVIYRDGTYSERCLSYFERRDKIPKFF